MGLAEPMEGVSDWNAGVGRLGMVLRPGELGDWSAVEVAMAEPEVVGEEKRGGTCPLGGVQLG